MRTYREDRNEASRHEWIGAESKIWNISLKESGDPV
jgi:hypothetical protein